MPRTVDLNLLLALQALLEERSVTRAAQRMEVSQPAASAALAKLRKHFNDDLLTRVGSGYRLTPLAMQLVERAGGAVTSAGRVFALQPDFDPARSDREFMVVLSDYALAALGPALARLQDAQAPGVRIHLRHVTGELVDVAPESLREVDAFVLPHGWLTDLPFQELIEDEWVCLLAADHPGGVPEVLTLAHLAQLPWVLTYHRQTAFAEVARELRLHGIEPDVRMVTESYLGLPAVLAGTNRVALVQRRLAQTLAAAGQVRAVPCPFPAAPLRLALWWHPINTGDPGHRWLRGLLAAAAAAVSGGRAATPPSLRQ